MSKNELVADLETLFMKTGPVLLTETTKSWLFITPDEVFKLKKQVRDDLQDLTSLRARHDNTLTEIDLNRRLAPDLYLGAVRVGIGLEGRLALDQPDAETVDWLVRMRRLPERRMLDMCISAGMSETQLAQAVELLSDILLEFYRTAPRSRLTATEILTVQEDQVCMAREVLLHPDFASKHQRFVSVLDRLENDIAQMPSLLSTRARCDGVVECHGDLRPEHVCLTDPPVVFDCLEFNRTLRLSDPFSEVVFLGMECAMLGADWIKPRLIARLESGLGVTADKQLMKVYEACHAVVRARLCFAHLLVSNPRTPKKWAPLGSRYMDVAERLLM